MKLLSDENRLDAERILSPVLAAAHLLELPPEAITDLTPLSVGLTNHSYRLTAKGQQYILRLPGAGTSALLDRAQEGAVHHAIHPLQISEQVIAFDSASGVKLSRYMEGCRSMQPEDREDVTLCLDILHYLHSSKAAVAHHFDLHEQLGNYARLCYENGSALPERFTYDLNLVYGLLEEVAAMHRPLALCHIDPVPANFLVRPNGLMRLIDWEYAGMADPLTDVAMFTLRNDYSYEQSLQILDYYLGRRAENDEIFTLFTLMTAGSLLWTLWAAYKTACGEDNTEYGAAMYRRYTTYAQFARLHRPAEETPAAGM